MLRYGVEPYAIMLTKREYRIRRFSSMGWYGVECAVTTVPCSHKLAAFIYSPVLFLGGAAREAKQNKSLKSPTLKQ